MKLALACVALLALAAGAQATIGMEVSKANDTVTVKLPSKTIDLTPELSMPRLPKIDVPGASLLANKSLELPSIPMPNLAAMVMMPRGKPNVTMADLAGALAGLSNLVSKPSVDLNGLASLVTAMASSFVGSKSMPSMPTVDMSTLTSMLSLLSKKNVSAPSLNLDLSALAALLNNKNLTVTLPSMPNMTMPHMPSIDLSALANLALRKPSLNLTMPDLSALKAIAQHVDDVNLTMPAVHELAKQLAAMRPAVQLPEVTISMPAKQKVDVVGLLSTAKSHMNASMDDITLILQTLQATKPNLTMPTISMPQMPAFDISTLAALAAAKPSVDLSGLTALANQMLSQPMPTLNLTVPDVAALASLAGKSMAGLNMSLPQMPEKINASDLVAAAHGVAGMTRSLASNALSTDAILAWLGSAGFTQKGGSTTSKPGEVVINLSGRNA